MEFCLFLLLMLSPSFGQYYDPAVTFTFLVEGENIQYGNQLRMSLFDLIVEIPYTPELARKCDRM